MLKQAIITSFLGKLKDRFCEYQEPITLEQKFADTARIPGVSGTEIVFPYEVESAEHTVALLNRFGLKPAAINVNVKPDPAFHQGAFSSPDRSVREKAVSFVKAGKDFAAAVGADKVTCAPLNDGYDYPFQVHYGRSWQEMVAALRDAAAYRPEIPLFVEYKPSEPRVRCLLDTAAKTVVLLHQVGSPALGCTLDVGHAIYAGENPAESLALCAGSGFPYYVHINDNNGKWDWDLMAGSVNPLQYLEFLFYLKELKYDGWITSDTSPVRQDRLEVFAFNARFTNQLWEWLDTIDRDRIRHHLDRHEALPILKMLEPHLFNARMSAR